jgi:glycogen phosphorylase
MRNFADQDIGYFSMEIAVKNDIPTYSGGLGVLAGDTLRSAADLRLKIIGVTLLYKAGYFHQLISAEGVQIEEPVNWNPRDHLERLPHVVTVALDNRSVSVCAWAYWMKGCTGRENPIIFLDTDLPENTTEDRQITSALYSGDSKHRLQQEAVLGIGGTRMLKALGCPIAVYHMNEGHSALLILELWNKFREIGFTNPIPKIRSQCVFTTHTPVPAGHDVFDKLLAQQILGNLIQPEALSLVFNDDKLNMTMLGLKGSDFVNAVAKKHGEVSRAMFPGYRIDSITNGVHSVFWTAPQLAALYSKHIPGWDKDPYLLRSAISIPKQELWEAHQTAKQQLIDYVNARGANMRTDVLTIGFARRMTPYKRAHLLFSNIDRLVRIAGRGLQIILSGKAHPRDQLGKDIIKDIYAKARSIPVRIHYIEDYNLESARMLAAGVDVWLNTPERPNEASGTSGMKAAHNGVPHFSVLDGWWLEGHIEGATGWSIGPPSGKDDAADAEDLYTKLERDIVPLYYDNRDGWTNLMRLTIATNASFFNTHRMLQQYVLNAYFVHQDDTIPDASSK